MPVIASYTTNQFDSYFENLLIVVFLLLLIIFIKINLHHRTGSQDFKVQHIKAVLHTDCIMRQSKKINFENISFDNYDFAN